MARSAADHRASSDAGEPCAAIARERGETAETILGFPSTSASASVAEVIPVQPVRSPSHGSGHAAPGSAGAWAAKAPSSRTDSPFPSAVPDLGGKGEANEALSASESRFRDFAAASSDWFWEMGPDLRFTWFSEDTFARCGMSPARMIGRTRLELRRGADGDDAAWQRHLADLNAHRRFRDFRYLAARDDGEPVYWSVSGIPLFDDAGRFRGYRGTGCNVTAEVLAERRAEQAQQWLRIAIESFNDGFALFDPDDRLLLWNASFQMALADVADVLRPGMTFPVIFRALVASGGILLAEDQREAWLEADRQRCRDKPATSSFPTADGRWIDLRGYPTADGGRAVIRCDVTRQKEAETALLRSKASLANAQRIARLGNWDLNVRSNEMSWSEEVFRILGLGLGLDETPASYELFIDSVHPGDRRTVDAAVRAALYANRSYAVEHRVMRPDGSIRFVHQEGEVVLDDEGVPLFMAGTIQDVTERRAAQQRIEETEERFRQAFETSVDGITFSRLSDGRYVDCNDAFTRMFGYSRAEVLGRTSCDIGIWADATEREQFVVRLAADGAVRNLVVSLARNGGEERTVMVSAGICMLGGEALILASLKDITDWERAESQLRTLWQAVEQSSVAVIITDALGRIEYVNPCFTQITGYARDEAVGGKPSLLSSGETPDREYAQLWTAITRGDNWHGEFCNRRKDGSLFWGAASISPVTSTDGQITHFVGIQADITERKRNEQELRASEERFRSLVETSLLGICIERCGVALFVNQTFAEIFGFDDVEEIAGLGSLDSLYLPDDRPRAAQLRDNGSHSPAEYEIRGLKRDGSIIWLHAQTRPVHWNGEAAVQSTVIDITLRKRYEDRLRYQASFDVTTDLPNRALGMDRLAYAIAAARRRATRVSLLFVDVDHFKKINDTLGHAGGDRCLREVANRLRASVREMDTVARVGGDEFVVVLPDIRIPADTEAVVAKIVRNIAEPFMLDTQEAFITLSIGAATFPEDGGDAESLVRSADAAMYDAKHGGRSAVRFFTPELQQRDDNRIRLEVALRHALERDQLTLCYQPLVDIRSRRIIGAEALLRWLSPELGQISPDRFVRIAEDTGLIVPIGKWVVATACRELRRWIDAGHDEVGLAVNVSSRQFRGPSLVEAVRRALAENRLDPERLELEITESLLIEDLTETRGTIDSLESCGVRLAVDDFGTGYSSLSYLSRIPLDTLKIDRSFTAGMLSDAGRATLVDALIALAHRLHFRVVAEGVETIEQLEFLRVRGCDVAQGYYFSRPLEADKFLALLEGWPKLATAAG